jgi:hypothetical protein
MRKQLQDKVVLAVGQSVKIKDTDVTLSFEEIEDSRCPTGVTCIWAGDAVVKIGVKSSDKPQSSLTLHTNSRFARDGEYEGYRITLTAVMPYPAGDNPPRRDQYRASLTLERK